MESSASSKDRFARLLEQATRFHIDYWVTRAAISLAHYLPTQISYRVSDLIAGAVYRLWPEKRLITIENLRHVLNKGIDEEIIKQTSRRIYSNYLRYLVDLLRLPSLDRNQLNRLVTASGWENLDRALQVGKGVIVVGLHFGCWDFAGAALAERSYPVNAVVESIGAGKAEDWVQVIRAQRGIRVIPLGYALRGVYRALRRNEIVALLIDRPSPEDGVPIRFFDGLTAWPRGPAAIALRTGAKIIVGYLVRQPDDTFTGKIEPPLDFEPSGDEEKDIQTLTQKIAEYFEGVIRRYPDQWYMFRRMWPLTEPPREAE